MYYGLRINMYDIVKWKKRLTPGCTSMYDAYKCPKNTSPELFRSSRIRISNATHFGLFLVRRTAPPPAYSQ